MYHFFGRRGQLIQYFLPDRDVEVDDDWLVRRRDLHASRQNRRHQGRAQEYHFSHIAANRIVRAVRQLIATLRHIRFPFAEWFIHMMFLLWFLQAPVSYPAFSAHRAKIADHGPPHKWRHKAHG